METIYYRRADGALVSRGSTTGDLVYPEGSTKLTLKAYEVASAKLQAENAKATDAIAAEEAATRESDVAVLVKLGLPEATARRMLRA